MGLFRPKRPRTGADYAGEVAGIGPGVEGFSVGDTVFGSAAPTGGGAFAEYVTVSPKFLTKIPEGISFADAAAVPMAARVVQKVGQEENPRNFLLMNAMGPNVAGVIGSAVAAGIMITLLG